MKTDRNPEDLTKIKQAALADFARYVSPQKARILRSVGLDIIEDRREGASIWDLTGRQYIDCISSAGSFNVGRRNPELVRVLQDALDSHDLGSFFLCHKPQADLARKFHEITPGHLQYTMFGTGGGEANDFAIKLARGYTGKTEIISTEKAYHGHTGFALSAIGRDVYKKPFYPVVPGFKQVPFNDLPAMAAAMNENTAAVLIEPVQGEGGVIPARDDYLLGLRELCDRHECLLILDEVQTGFGRTGKMFCAEHSGVVPDMITVGKSLSGGLYPISATVYKEELGDFLVVNPFVHLSTFGGSDLGCIVGLATIDYLIRHDLPGHAHRMGERFEAGFQNLRKKYPDLLLGTRRKGLMMGLQYTNESIGPRMSYQLAQNGVVALFSGNEPSVMRLMPPLVIQPEEVDRVLEALDSSMAAMAKQGGIEKY
jgi:putrescine aminotransferase